MPASGHAKSVARRRMPGRPRLLLNKRSACCEKHQRSASAIASYSTITSPERVRRWFPAKPPGSPSGSTDAAFEYGAPGIKAGRSTPMSLSIAFYESKQLGCHLQNSSGFVPAQRQVVLILSPVRANVICLVQRNGESVCWRSATDERWSQNSATQQRRFNASIIAGENAHTRQAHRNNGVFNADKQRQSF